MFSDSENKQKEDINTILLKMKDALNTDISDPSGPTYQSLRKLHAKCLLKVHRNNEAAFNLIESIAPSVRTMAMYRCERAEINDSKKNRLQKYNVRLKEMMKNIKPTVYESDSFLKFLYDSNKKFTVVDPGENRDVDAAVENKARKYLNKHHIKHAGNDEQEIVKLKAKLEELPKEWTVIQLTAGYDPTEQWQSQNVIKSTVNEFHITVLKNEFMTCNNLDPFTLRIYPGTVKYGEVPLFQELHSTLQENLNVIENNLRITNNCIKKYWERRSECDLRMKSVIQTMDKKWLGAWRCLLPGNLLSEHLRDGVKELVNDACRENKITVTPVQKMLLLNLVSSSHFMTPSETSMVVRKIFIEHSHCEDTSEVCASASCLESCKKCGETVKIEGNCVRCDVVKISATGQFKLFRKTFNELVDKVKNDDSMKELKHAKRGPVILFIDEKLDVFPWEVLPILQSHPVTRMECFSFTYGLFKSHEEDIVDGYFQMKPAKGTYLINPGGDLNRMEKRMSAFIDYWCPDWEGDKNVSPAPEMLKKCLQESDFFLYCGHNDGSRYIGEGVERLESARAVAALSGCGSVRLRPPGTRLLPIPVHSHYHLATCPSVIGMLWEVTDLEVDKITSMLLALFLPSKAPQHWGDVNKTQWTQGILNTSNKESGKFVWEPDLLRALATARKSSSFAMMAASIVARGLPVKINEDYVTK